MANPIIRALKNLTARLGRKPEAAAQPVEGARTSDPSRVLSTPLGFYPGKSTMVKRRGVSPPDPRTSTVFKSKIQKLRAFGKTIPAQRCKSVIKRQVLAMQWMVVDKLASATPQSRNALQRIDAAMRYPWTDRTYRDVVGAVIDDILDLGYGVVERHKGTGYRPFWFVEGDAGTIGKVKDWEPNLGDSYPRYLEARPQRATSRPIYDSQIFLVEYNATSWEKFPTSPLEVAMDYIEDFLGLSAWQRATTSKAAQEWLLNLVDASEEELKAFKVMWQQEFAGTGNIPVTGFKDAKSIKLGAHNDEGLYLKYQEMLYAAIALGFDLPRQAMNLFGDVNRATHRSADDAVFNQVVRPLGQHLSEEWNQNILQLYAPRYEHSLTDVNPNHDLEETRRTQILYMGGAITRNEHREWNGFAPEETDYVYVQPGASIIPVDEFKASRGVRATAADASGPKRVISGSDNDDDLWPEQIN